jgi:serine/threonine protein kinase
MQQLAKSLVTLEDADTRRHIAQETVALGRPEGGRPSSMALGMPTAGTDSLRRRLSGADVAMEGGGIVARLGRDAADLGQSASAAASASHVPSASAAGAAGSAGSGASFGRSSSRPVDADDSVELLALPLGARDEVWSDGVDIVVALHEVREATERRTALEKERKAMNRRLKALKKELQQTGQQDDTTATPPAATSSLSSLSSPSSLSSSSRGRVQSWRAGVGLSESPPSRVALLRLDHVQAEEALLSRLARAKQDVTAASDRLRALGKRRAVLKQSLLRVSAETQSRLRTRPTLNDRYQLLRLMGKGGFSEVWRALDLLTASEVAVKVHSTSEGWPEKRKQHYIKHAVREYEIHRSLDHANIVTLLDVFPIDGNSFATVMELCRGPDLDGILKERGVLAEKEARPIMLQVLSALRHLAGVDTPPAAQSTQASSAASSAADSAASPLLLSDGSAAAGDSTSAAMPPPSKRVAAPTDLGSAASATASRLKIIHYDLKPANVLFGDDATAKVTDFGLSKILDATHPIHSAVDGAGADVSSMELTSQGAGTYWYLPPECFATGGKYKVMISNKVDVWSLGVLFYQCLFGMRPFGHGMSQDALVRERVMLQARDVQFPAKPAISDGAKGFIRACLQHDQRLRPDVRTLCTHSYLQQN